MLTLCLVVTDFGEKLVDNCLTVVKDMVLGISVVTGYCCFFIVDSETDSSGSCEEDGAASDVDWFSEDEVSFPTETVEVLKPAVVVSVS